MAQFPNTIFYVNLGLWQWSNLLSKTSSLKSISVIHIFDVSDFSLDNKNHGEIHFSVLRQPMFLLKHSNVAKVQGMGLTGQEWPLAIDACYRTKIYQL